MWRNCAISDVFAGKWLWPYRPYVMIHNAERFEALCQPFSIAFWFDSYVPAAAQRRKEHPSCSKEGSARGPAGGLSFALNVLCTFSHSSFSCTVSFFQTQNANHMYISFWLD